MHTGKIQSRLAKDLHIDNGKVTAENLIARIVCNPLVGLKDPVVIQYAKDICHIVSEEGVLDGQTPQTIAAAAIIFSSSICSILHNNGNLHNGNNDSKGDQATILKNNVNVSKTIEIAFAPQIPVKKAYTIFCLNTELVTPHDLKDKLSKQRFRDKNGNVINWSKLIPTYDDLIKVNTEKTIKGEKISKSTASSSSSHKVKKSKGDIIHDTSPLFTSVPSSSNINISVPSHPSNLPESSFSKEKNINKHIIPNNLDVKNCCAPEISRKGKNEFNNTKHTLYTKNVVHDSTFINNEMDTKNDLCIETSRKLQKIA